MFTQKCNKLTLEETNNKHKFLWIFLCNGVKPISLDYR